MGTTCRNAKVGRVGRGVRAGRYSSPTLVKGKRVAHNFSQALIRINAAHDLGNFRRRAVGAAPALASTLAARPEYPRSLPTCWQRPSRQGRGPLAKRDAQSQAPRYQRDTRRCRWVSSADTGAPRGRGGSPEGTHAHNLGSANSAAPRGRDASLVGMHDWSPLDDKSRPDHATIRDRNPLRHSRHPQNLQRHQRVQRPKPNSSA